MKLVKIRENVTRSFAGDEEQEKIDNVSFEIRDENNARIGEVVVYNGGYSVCMAGATTSIDKGVAEVKGLLNITD